MPQPPPRELDVQQEGNVLVMKVTIPKVLDETTVQILGNAVIRMIEENPDVAQYVLDLGTVEYQTTAILGKWITADKNATRGGQHLLTFTHVRPGIYETFVITKLNKLFQFANTTQGVLDQHN